MDEFEWWRLDHLREGRLPASGGSERCCFFSPFFCWCDVFEKTTTKKSHLKTQNPHKLHFFWGLLSVLKAQVLYITLRGCEIFGPKSCTKGADVNFSVFFFFGGGRPTTCAVLVPWLKPLCMEG